MQVINKCSKDLILKLTEGQSTLLKKSDDPPIIIRKRKELVRDDFTGEHYFIQTIYTNENPDEMFYELRDNVFYIVDEDVARSCPTRSDFVFPSKTYVNDEGQTVCEELTRIQF